MWCGRWASTLLAAKHLPTGSRLREEHSTQEERTADNKTRQSGGLIVCLYTPAYSAVEKQDSTNTNMIQRREVDAALYNVLLQLNSFVTEREPAIRQCTQYQSVRGLQQKKRGVCLVLCCGVKVFFEINCSLSRLRLSHTLDTVVARFHIKSAATKMVTT